MDTIPHQLPYFITNNINLAVIRIYKGVKTLYSLRKTINGSEDFGIVFEDEDLQKVEQRFFEEIREYLK